MRGTMGISTANQGESLKGHLKNADKLMYHEKQKRERNKKFQSNKKSGGAWIRIKHLRSIDLFFILPIINNWITQSTHPDSE